MCDYISEMCSQDSIDNYYSELNQIWKLPPNEWHTEDENLKQKYRIILLSDIYYKKDEYEKFDKWFKKQYSPFEIIEHNIHNYDIILRQDNFEYDYLTGAHKKSEYGDGYFYEKIFKKYFEEKIPYFSRKLKYDSENDMFCLCCDSRNRTEELALILSNLYKDEKTMLELINKVKNDNSISYDIKI